MPRDSQQAQALAHYVTGLLWESNRNGTADVAQAFAAAHRLDPDSRPPLDALVIRLLQTGQTHEALDQLEAFCRQHPADVTARTDLARLAEVNHEFARAAQAYDEAYHLQPDDLPLAFARIRVLFGDGRDGEALKSMRRLYREHPGLDTRSLPAYWAIQFNRRAPSAPRALPCLELACEITTSATQRVAMRFLYGEVALATGQTNLAIQAFQDTLALNPQHLRAVTSLARVLYQAHGAAAITAQMRQVRNAATDVPGLLTLAALHLAAQDRTNAAAALARTRDALRAQQLRPPSDFYLLYGATLDELGRRDEAAELLLEALRHHPRAHLLMNYLAYLWAVANVHIETAAHWAQLAVKLAPRNGAYLDTLGWVRFRQQRLEESLDLLLRARAQLPDDPTILDHIGDVLASLQRTPEAAAYWIRSYALDPRQPPVADKLRAAGVNPDTIPRLEPRAIAPDPEDLDDE
jgi:tetratricopeptide (TPR) repeat protein